MSEREPDMTPGSAPLADRLDALAACWRAALAAPGHDVQGTSLRRETLELREVLAESAPACLVRVLDRLAALAEVWECLLADAPDAADEVGLFAVKGLSQVARAERSGGTSEAMLDLLLEQSATSWGEYLALLEPPDPEAPRVREEILADADDPDEGPAIDAKALLHLFGGSEPEEESEITATPTTPARPPQPTHRFSANPVPVRPAFAPPPEPPKSRVELVIPPLPSRIDLDDEIREAFLGDATELCERIQTLVLGLSASTDLGRDLNELRRGLHTLKGAAGSVGLGDLSGLVHELEEEIESSDVAIDPAIEQALHGLLGYLDGILDLLRRRAPATPAIAPVQPVVEKSTTQLAPGAQDAPSVEAAEEGPVRVSAGRLDDLMDVVSELIVRRRLWASHAETLKGITSIVRGCRSRMLGVLDRLHEAGLARPGRGCRIPPGADLGAQLRRLGELADDLAVLAESARAASLPLADHGDAMGRLSLQLWEDLQAIRIVPVRGLFQRLARVAHEAARVEGRRVEVSLVGEDTGVDRAVQDKAYEPLLHVVRNAVGHGIEEPAQRTAAGKPAAGRITLEARREGTTMVLAVSDDGRGLDLQAIEAKARRVGLLAPDERPGPERLKSLIFHPGFSTRTQANAISGRGVGMDVVAREVGLLKGTVEVSTELGRGTKLTIRLPARLALESAMIVRIDGQAFAVPVSQIEHVQPVESPGPEATMGRSHEVEREVVRFRETSIPVVRAREILGLGDTPAPPWPKLLVIRQGGGLVGLVVDAIEGTEDLVIKSLGTLLAGHPLVSGTSLATTGEVITILDASRLGRWVRGGAAASAPGTRAGRRTAGGPTVLVADDSISVRKVLARGLQSMNLDVEEVSDGLEALARLRARSYDLVVTDLEMPRLDGFGLVAEMQRVAALARIPVIVASTRADDGTRRRAMALGARTFLAKPVDPEALVAAVSPLLPGARPTPVALECEEDS